MVDVDPAELAKSEEAVHHAVHADAGAFMREMLRQARARHAAGSVGLAEAVRGMEDEIPGSAA